MTNWEAWQEYMSGFVSPQSYIDFGFYYLTAASLQRRVWLSASHSQLFPNLYVIPVGPPGVGKGLVIKQVADFLNYHKLLAPSENKAAQSRTTSDVDKELLEVVLKDDFKGSEFNERDKTKDRKDYEKPLLIPVAADASTYEGLVRRLAKSKRRYNYTKFCPELNKNIMDIYTHSSLCFCLEEISSLFRRHTEDTVNLLIKAYDCGDYEYDAKTPGLRDRVKNCCLNFFGGTTPEFMQDTFNDKLISQGFASRTMFIYETKNRFSSFFVPDLTPKQVEARQQIRNHIYKMSLLYGKAEIDKNTQEFLEEWWQQAQNQRSNNNPKLDPYYGRKNIHVAKLAMAVHFSESTSMMIERKSFEKAMDILAPEEKKMHFALGLDNTNPLSRPMRKIIRYLEATGRKSKREILVEFFDTLPNKDALDDILSYAVYQQKIKEVGPVPHPITKLDTLYYDVFRDARPPIELEIERNGHE